jgi:hypothetical protein
VVTVSAMMFFLVFRFEGGFGTGCLFFLAASSPH